MSAQGAPLPDTACESMHLALAGCDTLGEGLLWDPVGQQWWWTDIAASTVQCWPAADTPQLRYFLPERVGSLARCRSGRMLLGLAKRLCLADPRQARSQQPWAVRTLVDVEAGEARTCVNDGRTDRRGYFVFGSMNEMADGAARGAFYQYSLQHGLRRLSLPPVAIANSICFSLDGATMYFTDTPTRRIMQCDYDAESAQIGRIRLFAEMDAAHAYPDGSVVDADGCLWNAQWGAARVVRYAPDGTVLRRIAVPALNPTCPAFGGPSMRQLCVTTARQDMNAVSLANMPQTGSLFTFEPGDTTGVLDALFDDLASPFYQERPWIPSFP